MATSMGDIVARLVLNISSFTNSMNQAEDRVRHSQSTFDQLGAVGDRMAGVGTKMALGLTTPIVGMGVAVTNTAATFEQKMSKVQGIGKLTGDELDNLKDKAKEMGATTKFSASESADALSYMAMAGWDAEQMSGGLGGIMSLAAASGEDLAMVSDIVTDSLTAFGMSAEDSGKVADVLATASSNANTNVSMLGESFKYVAPVAGSLGYSVEDTAVALGLMANAGIKGGQAGTSLRSALTRLIQPTDDAAALMEKYNINVTNQDGTMKTLAQTQDMLRDRMGGLDEATQAQIASTLFGKEAMSGMLAIINTSTEDYTKLTQEINNSKGSAEEMSAVMQDNLAGKFTLLKSQIEGVAIQLGEILIPIISNVVGKIMEWVTWFGNLDQGTQQTILMVLGLVAAMGPLLAIVGNAIKLIGVMRTVITFFSNACLLTRVQLGLLAVQQKLTTAAQWLWNAAMAANPITWVIVGIVALVAAIVILWNKSEKFRNFVINMWDAIKSVFGAFVDWVVNTWNSMTDGVSDAVGGIYDAIVGGIGNAISWIKNLPGQAFSWGKDMIQGMINGINNMKSKIGGAARGIASKVSNFLHFTRPDEGPLRNYETWMPDMIEGLSNSLQARAPRLVESVKSMSQAMSDALSEDSGLLLAAQGADTTAIQARDVYTDGVTTQRSEDNPNTDSSNSSIIIEKIVVRDDDDLNKVTKGIYDKNSDTLRAMGRRDL